MALVGMKHDDIAGPAGADGALVIEALQARERVAQRISVVSAGACFIQSPGEGPHDRSRREPPRRGKASAMRFDTKIAILVHDELALWQKLNVASFLAGGLVGAYPELAGERYVDGSGRVYGP